MQSMMTSTAHSKLKHRLHGREARIVLTPECNYRCVFCHHEGLDTSTAQDWKPSPDAIRSILDGVLNAGCEDITLTGGEPLIFKPIVLEIIRHVHSANPSAKVTIVSNASLMDESWLSKAAAFRNLRMNVSIHSADPDAYRIVTAQDRYALRDIADRLRLLTQYNVPFKLNAVALRKRNDAAFQIASLCAFAHSHGASALKIL